MLWYANDYTTTQRNNSRSKQRERQEATSLPMQGIG